MDLENESKLVFGVNQSVLFCHCWILLLMKFMMWSGTRVVLESYETLLSRDAALQEIELPTSFKAGNLILAIGNSVKSLVERGETIWKRVEVADKWVEEVVPNIMLVGDGLSHIHVGTFVEMIGDQCYDLCKEHESTVMNQYHR